MNCSALHRTVQEIMVDAEVRVSNTPGNPGNLLEISKVSWKFSC